MVWVVRGFALQYFEVCDNLNLVSHNLGLRSDSREVEPHRVGDM